jgi:Kef-type K+ transport system membrane component KefB
VNPLVVLMGLLVLAYVGSFLAFGHSIRGVGLPSGTEYILLGVVLGPHVTGVVEGSMLATFDPIADVAVGWIALLIGFGFGVEAGKPARVGAVLGGSMISLFTGGAIFGVLWFVTGKLMTLATADRVVLVGGIAAACSETTRQAVRWVAERHAAKGPLSTLLGELSQSDDLSPIAAVVLLFALSSPARLPFAIAWWQWALLTVGFGVLLGAMAALLLGRDFRRNESWGVLLGLGVMGIGINTRLGLCSIGTMFVMGSVTALFSKHRTALREMVGTTELAVLHPLLVLAGARVDLPAVGEIPFLLLFAVAARMAAKSVSGLLLGLFVKAARPAGAMLGMGLLSSGALSMTIGLAFALRFPGIVGGTVLAAAATVTVFGEFVGPTSLRVALRQAGEIVPEHPGPARGAEPDAASP